MILFSISYSCLELGALAVILDRPAIFEKILVTKEYHDESHNVLSAYGCYNPKIGYISLLTFVVSYKFLSFCVQVQGMSFLAAILLLNMESSDGFICLSNYYQVKKLALLLVQLAIIKILKKQIMKT